MYIVSISQPFSCFNLDFFLFFFFAFTLEKSSDLPKQPKDNPLKRLQKLEAWKIKCKNISQPIIKEMYMETWDQRKKTKHTIWNRSVNANRPFYFAGNIYCSCPSHKWAKKKTNNPEGPTAMSLTTLWCHSATLLTRQRWNYSVGWRAFIGRSSGGKRFASSS